MNMKSFLAAAVSTVGILTLSSPANAVVYDWSFTNTTGDYGDGSEVISGFVEFDAPTFASLANQTNVPAVNLQITSAENLDEFNPFFDSRLIELNDNLVNGNTSSNSFGFNESGSITDATFFYSQGEGDRLFGETERFGWNGKSSMSLSNDSVFCTNSGGFFDPSCSPFLFRDSFATSLSSGNDNIVTQDLSSEEELQTSVPFEFSPTLGLVLAGSFLAGSRWLKYRFK